MLHDCLIKQKTAVECVLYKCRLSGQFSFMGPDCLDMAPEPFRGKRNDPGYLPRMAEKLAEIRGISVEEAITATTENAKRLYQIDN